VPSSIILTRTSHSALGAAVKAAAVRAGSFPQKLWCSVPLSCVLCALWCSVRLRAAACCGLCGAGRCCPVFCGPCGSACRCPSCCGPRGSTCGCVLWALQCSVPVSCVLWALRFSESLLCVYVCCKSLFWWKQLVRLRVPCTALVFPEGQCCQIG